MRRNERMRNVQPLFLMLFYSLSIPELVYLGLFMTGFELLFLSGFRETLVLFSLISVKYLVLRYSLDGMIPSSESIVLSQSLVFFCHHTQLRISFGGLPWLLIFYWVVLIIGSVLIAPLLRKKSLIWARKLFHFCAILMFIPAIYIDVAFLRFSFVAALLLGTLLECLQIDFAREWMSQFLDDKDVGKRFILSHLYLLFGCAFPLFMTGENNSEFILSSGILILGIGDSVAALFGSVYGKTKWNNTTKKTVEGSLFAFSAMCIVLLIFGKFDPSHLLCTMLAVIYEGCTLDNDNLVVPILYSSLLRILC